MRRPYRVSILNVKGEENAHIRLFFEKITVKSILWTLKLVLDGRLLDNTHQYSLDISDDKSVNHWSDLPRLGHGLVITSIALYGMQLLVHVLTSTAV